MGLRQNGVINARKPHLPLLTIITAAHKWKPEYVLQAWQSITTTAPDTWDLEWCIQEDGPASNLGELLAGDQRVHYVANNVHAGAATTRNWALSRAKGSWILNLDCDDFYIEGGISTLVNTVERFPQSLWVAGRAHDYIEESDTFVEFPNYLKAGSVSPEQIRAHWVDTRTCPIHFAGAGMRADVMRALGGYAGLPFEEDTSLFGAAAMLGNGAYTSDVVFAYRRWDGQTHQRIQRQAWRHHNIAIERMDAVTRLLDLRNPTNLEADPH